MEEKPVASAAARSMPAGVIDVPDGLLMQGATFRDLKKSFERTWGFEATAVCLPIATPRRLYFDSSIGYERRSISYGDANDQYALPGLVTVAAQAGLDVYLSVFGTLPYTGFAAGDIVDIAGDTSAQACPWNPDMRGMLGDVISEAVVQCHDSLGRHGLESRLVGLAIDAVDLWPMSAEADRMELTCFCEYCRDYLRVQGVDSLVFERFPNPWNLCLRDTGTGVGYISDFRADTKPEQLLEVVRRRGYLDKYKAASSRNDQQLEDDADAVLRYARARHSQVVAILSDLFTRARDSVKTDLRRVVITEGDSYDWTGGTFVRGLDDASICDELWYDVTNDNIRPQVVGFRPYMWTRSRYGVDAFFDFVEQIRDPRFLGITQLARRSPADLTGMLRERARVVLSGSIRVKGITRLLEKDRTYLGLVDTALTLEWVDRATAAWSPEPAP